MDTRQKCIDAAARLMGEGPADDLNPAYAMAGIAMQMFPDLKPDDAAIEKMAAYCEEKMAAEK